MRRLFAAIKTKRDRALFAVAYRLERRRCGKPTCKCARPDHPGHGPYIYKTRTVNGKTRREYLGGPFTQRKR